MTRYVLTTPRGNPALLDCRDGTNDLSTAGSVFAGVAGSGLVDEYDLRTEYVTGVFVDVGAHIGAVTVAVLLDNPDARAICVEPLPENADLIDENLKINGLTERATVIRGAVGAHTVRYGEGVNRFVGNMRGANGSAVTVPAVTLSALVKEAGGEIEFLKTDCEGGEWALLAKRSVQHVARIVGEYHGRTAEDIVALLDATHDVAVEPNADGLGLFRAVRR